MGTVKKVVSFICVVPFLFILSGCQRQLTQEKAIVKKESNQATVFMRGDVTISCSSLLEKSTYCVKNEKKDSFVSVKSTKKKYAKTTDQTFKKTLLCSFLPLGFEIVSLCCDGDVVTIQAMIKQLHKNELKQNMMHYSFEMERQGWKQEHVFFDTKEYEWIGFFSKPKNNSFVIRVSRKKKLFLFFSKIVTFDCKIILIQS